MEVIKTKAKVKKVESLGHALLGGRTHFMIKNKHNTRYITANEVMDMLGLRPYKPWEPEYYFKWKL